VYEFDFLIVILFAFFHNENMSKAKKLFFARRMGMLLILVLMLSAVSFYLITKHARQQPQVTAPEQLSAKDYAPLLVQVAVWYPSAPWSTPAVTTEETPVGELKGQFIKATVTQNEAMLPHFEDVEHLSSKGYTLDETLSADGPGSSTWGYSKTVGDRKDILLFSYTTKPSNSNPNEPLQFNCPCHIEVTVFTSDAPVTSMSLANPASVNCTEKGGTLTIEKNGSGGEFGLCNFDDDMSCEEWALYRGECPVGGVRTTGYDTIDQKYCAWTGGTTLAVSNSVCTLPGGTKCSTIDHYNGTC